MKINFKKKIPSIKFYGNKQEVEYKNSSNQYVITKRIIILIGISICLVLSLVARFAYIQFTQNEVLNTALDTYGSTTYSLDAPRGEITDRNGTVLAANNNIITVTYFTPQSITSGEIKTIAKFLSKNIKLNMDDLTSRNKKDYFIMAHQKVADSLVTQKERNDVKGNVNASAQINKLILERITDDLINQYMTSEDLEYYHFMYTMENTTSGSSILAENITVEEASLIGENANLLKGIKITSDWQRTYNTNNNFTQVLGKVTTKKQGIPSTLKDALLAEGYDNNSRVGTSGLEQQYEQTLTGEKTTYSLNYDANGYPIIVNKNTGQAGNNLKLSIDWDLQSLADNLIETELKKMNSSNKYFEQMFFMMMDPNTGQVLVMSGKQINKQTGEVTDYAAGNYLSAYLIGSTSKGGTLYMGFKNNAITPNTYQVDEPIKIKGTKVKKSWKTMGNINEVDALAYSSNVYMFKVGMKVAGVNYVPNESLKINAKYFSLLRKDFGELGLGVKTGIDIPNEQLGYHGDSTQSGHFLDACIGQFDTYTNAQLVQYACSLANGGKRVKPQLMLSTTSNNSDGTSTTLNNAKTDILDDNSDQTTAFNQIKQGMRACVTRSDGTCNSYWSTKSYTTYAKTGTAELYDAGSTTDYPNHLQIGYIAKDENSKASMAFACICVRETQGSAGSSSAPLISNQIMDAYVQKYGLN